MRARLLLEKKQNELKKQKKDTDLNKASTLT